MACWMVKVIIMSESRPGTRTAAALEARKRSTAEAVKRIYKVIATMQKDGQTITVAAIARRADVSRTFIYSNSEIRGTVENAKLASVDGVTGKAVNSEESVWRDRALNAESGVSAAHNEIIVQRARIGELIGQIRDLQSEWSEEDLSRILAENRDLKQQIRALAIEYQDLIERYDAARSNLKFQDRRLAELEAQLADPEKYT